MAKQASSKILIIIWDCNAKTGQPLKDEHIITGKYGYGNRRERGQRSIDFAFDNRLSVINFYFKQRTSRRWTWSSPGGAIKNEIDYILPNQPKLFLNIETQLLPKPLHRPETGKR